MRIVMLVVMCLLGQGCAFVDATADPTNGRLTAVHYRGFLRDYAATLEESKDGIKVQIGAKSDTQAASELLGAAVGAATTLAGKGMMP